MQKQIVYLVLFNFYFLKQEIIKVVQFLTLLYGGQGAKSGIQVLVIYTQ